MLKKGLIITLLKSNQSYTELGKSEDNNTEIEETKKIFNKLRNSLSRKKLHNIRRKFYLKKHIPEYLKENILTEQEKKEDLNSLKKTEKYSEKLKENLNKLKKH